MEHSDKDEELKKKTKQLQLLIEKYNKELERVQEECSHKEEIIKMVHNDNGVFEGLRIVCDSCNKVIGYPSKTQSNEFYGKT